MRPLPVSASRVIVALSGALLGACTSTDPQPTRVAGVPPYESGDPSVAGYRYEEAAQFIEFCVELDNQDDRVKHPANRTMQAQVDSSLWTLAYDSRRAVADDVFAYSKQQPLDEENPWAKLYKQIIRSAERKYPKGWTADKIYEDPDLNGFGPWQNAWLLYEGRGKFAGTYAIAIRGTVFSNEPSAAEDAWFHTVSASGVVSGSVSFADAKGAVLHSGFAHATFTLMLDKKYGVLSLLRSREVPANARLYIVGHSQGAAMATLAHSFLHYAMRDDELRDKPVFDLKGKRYRLKSYGFAQPKPGNYAYSSDFARITQRADNAIVINNDIDPVPKVPLTQQGIGDVEGDFRGASFAVRTVQFISSFGKTLRLAMAGVAEPFITESAKGYSFYYNYESLQKPLGPETTKTSASWNFASAGRVLFVFGSATGDPKDLFFQHHATTYRELIHSQLAALGN